MKRKLKKAITIVLLAVLVFTLTAGSSCVGTTDPNSWGTSLPTSSGLVSTDYIDEYEALDDAFVEMDALLDELARAIAAAKEATEDCSDITLLLVDALAANDTATARSLLSDGEEVLELAEPVYESLLDAIEAVEAQQAEIDAILERLNNAGQSTDDYDTGDITDTLADGETASGNLLTAMNDLKDALDEAREVPGITEDVTLDIAQNQGGSDSFGYDVLFVAWGRDARYVRHTQAIDVIDLYVSVAGNNLRYQWYANTNNSNTGGTPISGATNSTYKPLTQDLGITYYYCVATAPSGYSIPSLPISVQVFASQAELNLSITRQPISKMYMQGDTVSEESSLFIEATGANVGYQWYATNSEGIAQTLIQDATQNRYAPPTDQVGEFYYSCVVSAPHVNSLISNTVKVQVLPYLAITSQPQGAQYTQGATAAPLTTSAEGENLGYQWYIDSGIPTVANTPIEGATAASYTPPTNTLGTVRYFCEVSSIVNGQRNVLTTQAAAVEVIAVTPTLTASPTTASAGAAITYTYNLGAAQEGVNVQFTFPTGAYSATVAGLTGSGASYSGTTNANGQISFTVTVDGFDSAIDYTVTATDSTYHNTATQTVRITL